MPAGLSVFLDDGSTIQIDDSFVNMGLISKHSVYCGTLPFAWTRPHGYLTVQGITPLVAVKSSVRFCLYGCTISGNNHTFDFITETPATIEVYVFDVPTSIGTFGLQTFRPDGTLCFDSSRKYLRVVANLEYGNYQTLINNPPLIPSSGDMAILVNRFTGAYLAVPYGSEGESFTQTFIDGLFCRINGSTISANYIYTIFSGAPSSGFGQWNYEQPAVSLQVVDVTNY